MNLEIHFTLSVRSGRQGCTSKGSKPKNFSAGGEGKMTRGGLLSLDGFLPVKYSDTPVRVGLTPCLPEQVSLCSGSLLKLSIGGAN